MSERLTKPKGGGEDSNFIVMGSWMSRVTEIENTTDQTMELRECPEGDPEGKGSEPILLHPHKSKWIPATKFCQHSHDAARPRHLILVSSNGGGGSPETFATTDFITFEKFVIFRRENENIGVQTSRAKGTGFRRINDHEQADTRNLQVVRETTL
ncbi:hypothetical protein Pyn_24713 [Prunus yedoensis var. nudiflora]|uniref:Uncharacterized protein n=1 Tax=Prunus yedoensis var. nudiflora TaxID=2094558 RepID=A0A314Y618_PRUYE|nr:hypothetical protein Pyn_24713 [Prunus yedoensis var. nudiflora]